MSDWMGPLEPGMRLVLITGLRLPFHIGIYDFEKGAPQSVRIDAALFVEDVPGYTSDNIDDYVSYADVVEFAKVLSASGTHIELVEQLAERLAEKALEESRVLKVRVRALKEDIFPEAEGVGVLIERTR